MSLLRSLAVVGCLLFLLPAHADAAPQNQTFDCTTIGAFFYDNYLAYREVSLDGVTLQLRICAPNAQAINAEQLIDVLASALPKLSRHAGVPLGGGRFERPILIVPDDDLPGANGDFGEGIIRLRSTIAERTVIHEGAHYWANDQNFTDLWMIEGYADYLTEQVTGKPRMAPLPDSRCDDVVLLNWQYQPRGTVMCGYVVGASVFRDLARAVGSDQLRAGLRELRAEFGPIDSSRLLTGLERASSQDLTPIFIQHHVFPPEYALERREQERRELQRQQGLAANLGIDLPPQIAVAIDAGQFDRSDQWLSRLGPFLEAAGTISRRCKNLALTCEHPWQPVPPNPDGLEPRTTELLGARKLLDQYAALRDGAQAIGLKPPAGLTDAAAALHADADILARLSQALDILNRGRALEQACTMQHAPCPADWRDSWGRNDLALADRDITIETDLLTRAPKAENRCGAAIAACHAVWHDYFRHRQFGETKAALDNLSQLLKHATGVEKRCGELGRELADICRADWQTGLRNGQLVSLKQTLDNLDLMLARGKELDKACAEAGWACARIWRALFMQSGDPQPVTRYLDEVRAALPILSKTAAITGEPASGLGGWLQRFSSPDAPTLLAATHRAFDAGDIAGARTLAEQASAAHARPRTSRLPAGLTGGAFALLLAGVFGVRWHKRWRRARTDAKNRELLAALLVQPPSEKRSEEKKKKAA